MRTGGIAERIGGITRWTVLTCLLVTLLVGSVGLSVVAQVYGLSLIHI